MINVVCGIQILNLLKQSKYFKKDFGQSVSIMKGLDKVLNDKDKFVFDYNMHYKTSIMLHGNIGSIKFYLDYSIHDNTISMYKNNEEFRMKFDINKYINDGVEKYIGSLINLVNIEFEKMNLSVIEEPQSIGSASKLFTDPGAVSMEDIKKYLEETKKNNKI